MVNKRYSTGHSLTSVRVGGTEQVSYACRKWPSKIPGVWV